MSGWQIEPTPQFAKQLRKLDSQIARRVVLYLDDLVATGQPRERGAALSGDLGEYWKYRVGNFRIICEIIDDRLVILALRVGHRSAVYRDTKW